MHRFKEITEKVNLSTVLRDTGLRSTRVQQTVVLLFIAMVVGFLWMEFLVDIRSTEPYLLLPILAVLIALYFLSYKKPNWWGTKLGIPLSAFLILELHCIYNPLIYHEVIFWMAFVPLFALIVGGIRSSLMWTMLTLLAILGNAWYVIEAVGDHYMIIARVFPFTILSVFFICGILVLIFILNHLLGSNYELMKVKSQDLSSLSDRLKKKNKRLHDYHTALTQLSRQKMDEKDIRSLYQAVEQSAIDNMKVIGLSIWFFDKEHERLSCQYHSSSDPGACNTLFRKENPIYFKVMDNLQFIENDYNQEFPEMRELSQKYLSSSQEVSVLDCPIYEEGRIIGLLCAEKKMGVQNWRVEDTLFLQSLADFVSIGKKNVRIQRLWKKIRAKNLALIEQQDAIEQMNNELTRLNGDLNLSNSILEEKVKERTARLKQQNKQLSEYAFINSHLLRAPLSRILGLSYLISHEATSIDDKELVDALYRSSQEMDSIIHQISTVLEKGYHLSPAEIEEIFGAKLISRYSAKQLGLDYTTKKSFNAGS